jgi:hypothetical protein
MTDFTNPVFSGRRAALLRYVPEEIRGGNPGEALESRFAEGLRAAISAGDNGADNADSPEREFLSNWDTPDFEATFVERISKYFVALKANMSDAVAVDGWFRLAEHRRRRFRRRPLAEFSLTTPRSNIPRDAPPLRMTPQGLVEPM